MAEFKFNCPQCGQKIEADESYCGQVADCPHCGKKFVVPENEVQDPKDEASYGHSSKQVSSDGQQCEEGVTSSDEKHGHSETESGVDAAATISKAKTVAITARDKTVALWKSGTKGKKAAKQGNPSAQCNLGVIYYNGREVPMDRILGLQLLRSAAAQGDSNTKEVLFRITNGY